MHVPKVVYCFIAGGLFANAVPHLVHGVSGETFPTYFSRTSSPVVNVIYSFGNAALGWYLAKRGGFSPDDRRRITALLVGFAAVSLFLSVALPIWAKAS